MSDLCTVKQLAEKHKISKARIYKLLNEGKIEGKDNPYNITLVSNKEYLKYKSGPKPGRGAAKGSYYEGKCSLCGVVKRVRWNSISKGVLCPPVVHGVCLCGRIGQRETIEMVYKGTK